MLRKLAFWLTAAPFIPVLIVALVLLAISLTGIYFFMEVFGAPEAEWSA